VVEVEWLLVRTNMRRFWLFALMSAVGGLGAFLGSLLGNAAGKTGLFAGAIVGGAIAIALGIRLAARLALVPKTRIAHATLGALGGFALAALVAVNTLSSPVGPVLSVALIGLGAVFGAARVPEDTSDRAV
jgi:hypothetical protein